MSLQSKLEQTSNYFQLIAGLYYSAIYIIPKLSQDLTESGFNHSIAIYITTDLRI